MEFENILNNDEYKMFFLKAILLGIKYGQSNNPEYYINSIEQEINRTNNKKIYVLPEKKIVKNSNIEKIENTLIQLENQKNYTLSLINKLSSNNYGSNYSRINLLKSNLLLIIKEIEKNKFALKKNKELLDKKENVDNDIKIQSKNIFKKMYDKPQPVILKEQKEQKEQKENLVGELERSLGSLSNLIM